MRYLMLKISSYICYIIAEGFRFMPLSLVRLRTFRLSAWVSWVQPWCRWSRVSAHRADMSLRCHNSQRRNKVTGCGWRHAPEARGGLCENLKEVRELGTRCQTRRIDFWSSETRGELAPYGGGSRREPLEMGAKWIRQHRRLCLSSLRRNLYL